MIDYSNIPRDSRRVPLETRVQFRFDRFSGFISEFSSNISPGGLFIRTDKPLPAGQMLDFEFRLGDGFELINGRGQVVWTRLEDEGPNRPAGMGIRFLELSEGSKELIYKIVDTYIQEGGIPFDLSLVPPDPVSSPARAPEPVRWPPPLREETGRDLDDTAWPLPLEEPASPVSSPSSAGGMDPAPGVPNYLPALSPPPEPRPASFKIAGSASAKAPARPFPLLLLLIGAVAVLAAVLFVFRDQWLGWVGLGGEEVIAEAGPPRPLPRPRVNPGASALSTDLTTDLAAAPETQETPEAEEPEPATLPEPVRRKPAIELDPAAASPAPAAPAPAAPATSAASSAVAPPRPSGPPASALDRISWNPLAGGGTEIVLWGNGSIRAGAYTRVRLDASPPREVVRIQGMRRPYPQARVPVGSGEVVQVRTGYHPGNELHVVLDLASPGVRVARVVEDGNKLRIELRKR